MIKIIFFGHENILGTHPKTFEFSKDSQVTPNGDCIIGVNSVVSYPEEFHSLLKEKRKVKGKILVELAGKKAENTFTGILNPEFDIASQELVFRRSFFSSPRTIVLGCDKTASELSRGLIELLKNRDATGICYLLVV
ncbi:MAG TPA: DUF371 domain-containing protein [Candidatus Woesearchaeota archaeon]|nr:DUF371 domain-containing protein [Candidatus Woesearchaeota archaeon]